jgi:hypothetical protein
MANKGLATRQKMRLTVAPSQQIGKPRNPVAVAAKLRAAGPHAKPAGVQRQLAKQALKKVKLELEE